jgi:hypothetical protein
MMRMEQNLVEDLVGEYIQEGWRIENPEQALPLIHFQPDLLLRRGEKFLVVEVKRPGMSADRPVAELRKAVERQPNWRLEVKLLSPHKELATRELALAETPGRLALAEDLLRSGNYADAVMMAWLAIETSLRMTLSTGNGKTDPTSVPELFRTAFEAEKISDLELHQLQRGFALRNGIVHGFAVSIDAADARSIVDLARSLADRVGAAAS